MATLKLRTPLEFSDRLVEKGCVRMFANGLGMIAIALFYAVLISIPLFIVLLLIKTFNKAARIDEVELEVKKLREEIQSLQDKLLGGPKK